jgi:hypothetical protein
VAGARRFQKVILEARKWHCSQHRPDELETPITSRTGPRQIHRFPKPNKTVRIFLAEAGTHSFDADSAAAVSYDVA